MIHTICYWDDIAKCQRDRDATEEEAVEIDARIADSAASESQRQRDAIQAKIDQLERASMENRGAREIHLRLMEREAGDIAAANPPATVEQVLAATPYYVKLKALDTEIHAMRTEMSLI
jgi:hypothetical protein